MKWYVIHLLVELDKFLTRYHTLPQRVREQVTELVTLRRPEKGMYQRDLGMFVGYVFLQARPGAIGLVDDALQSARIAEVLTVPLSKKGRSYVPLSQDDEDWLYGMLRTPSTAILVPGTRVTITTGPYEGMQGTVEYVVGQTVAVRVPLRKATSLALCVPDELEAA